MTLERPRPGPLTILSNSTRSTPTTPSAIDVDTDRYRSRRHSPRSPYEVTNIKNRSSESLLRSTRTSYTHLGYDSDSYASTTRHFSRHDYITDNSTRTTPIPYPTNSDSILSNSEQSNDGPLATASLTEAQLRQRSYEYKGFVYYIVSFLVYSKY
jgi:hypothetical protein